MAVVAGFVVYLICLLVALILPLLGFPLAVVVGGFIGHWALAIAIVAALAYFFGGGPVPSWWPR